MAPSELCVLKTTTSVCVLVLKCWSLALTTPSKVGEEQRPQIGHFSTRTGKLFVILSYCQIKNCYLGGLIHLSAHRSDTVTFYKTKHLALWYPETEGNRTAPCRKTVLESGRAGKPGASAQGRE